MSGIEFAAELRHRNLIKHIIFASGFADIKQAGGTDWQADDLLPKPYRKADLARRIEKLIGKP